MTMLSEGKRVRGGWMGATGKNLFPDSFLFVPQTPKQQAEHQWK